MIREEWRLHKSLIGGLGSGAFPLMIFLFTVVGGLITPTITENIDLRSLLLMLHVTSFFYGFFVGGVGRISEHVMTRQLGQINLLLQLPQLYPVSFKQIMSIFYLKDAIYYLVYSFVPLLLGMGMVAPHVGINYGGVGVLGVTLFLSFMIGMSLSFMLSTLSSRSRVLALMVSGVLFGFVLLVYPLRILPVDYILLAFGYWETRNIVSLIISVLVSGGFAGVGVLCTREQYKVNQSRYAESLLLVDEKLRSIGSLRTITAKEWLELRRSGSLFPTLISFAGPLLVIYLITWIFQIGFKVPLNFNVVFFSGFVGFAGVMTYSVLTNIEHNEYFNVLPVTVDSVVKAKFFLYFTVTSIITAGYVLLIGILKGEVYYVPVGLVVSTSTSIFVVTVVAYLTGLWTNTMFFGAKTIMKFSGIVVPPLIIIEIASMMLQFNVQTAMQIIIGLSGFLFIVSWVIFRQLGNKWKNTEFSFASTIT